MRSRVTIFLMIGALAGVACSDEPCGVAPTAVAGAPVVDNFFLLDETMPGDPWTLIFAARFTDSDGDLGTGNAEFFINDATTATSTRDLFSVFRSSGLEEDETSGEMALALRFTDVSSDDFSVRLGLQLLDAQENRSNCYSLRLDFDVEAVSSTEQSLGHPHLVRATRVACRLGA